MLNDKAQGYIFLESDRWGCGSSGHTPTQLPQTNRYSEMPMAPGME